jgi:phosphate transport system substrate-binding protein
MSRSHRVLGCLAAVLLLLSCGPRAPEQAALHVSGAWALYPLMVQWAQAYQKVDPSLRIDVSAGGAGKGIADTLGGLVELGMVSREISPEEAAKGAVFVPVARDATFPIMNAANPALAGMRQRGLPKARGRELWIGNQPLTWGQLAGTGATLKARPYTRSDSCGAGEVWANYLGGRQPDLTGLGVYGDPGIAEAVRKDPAGIGYGNLNYVYDARTGLPVEGLAVIPLDGNGNGRIDAEEELSTKAKAIHAIRSGAYPAPPARDLYLVAKGNFKGPAGAFVAWILGDGQRLVDPAGYIQVSEARLQEAKGRLAQ